MKVKQNIIQIFWKLFKSALRLLGNKNKALVLSWLSENNNPFIEKVIDKEIIKYYCPSTLSLSRSKDFIETEPETIEWLNQIKKGDDLLEIGSNIGNYSLYAAKIRKSNVTAIEPYYRNFSTLVDNIILNNEGENIKAFCIGAGNITDLEIFNMESTGEGAAGKNLFGAKDKTVANLIVPIYRMDDFFEKYRLKFPNFIKIDVDGYEKNVIDGMQKILSSSELISVIIEIYTGNDEHYQYILNEFFSKRFKLTFKGEGLHANHIFIRN
jgi:FkbM family methyltransferase